MSRSTSGATNNSSSSANKKQDEKNLKALRELVALPHNKQCFDCLQRGPTYVNTTIGSFVCTSCSGRLRGLNPPHRLKSISMATFTNDEIELMRSRGNEYCRRVWMGKYDKSRASIDESSFKDETQMKDFMALKYEKKRWYVNPNEIQFRSPDTSSSIPEQSSCKADASPLIGYNNGHTGTSTLPVSKSGASSSATSSKFNAETTSLHLPPPTSDPFGSPVAISRPSATHEQPSFNANFANFNAFTNGTVGGSNRGQSSVFDDFSPSFPKSITLPAMPSSAQHPPKTTALPAADKYSALKELDELFSSTCSSTAVAAPPPSSCAAPIAGSGAQPQAGVAWGAAGSSLVNVPPANQFFGSSPGAVGPTTSVLASSEAGSVANAWSATAPFGAGAGRAVYNPFTSPQPQPQFRAPQQTWSSHPVAGGSGPAAPSPVVNPFSVSQSFAQHQPHHTESKAWNPFMN